MNNILANILKSRVETLEWADRVAGLVQTANVRVKDGDSVTEKSYPISCNVTYDACIKGKYRDLAPDSKKKSVIYFEDRGGSFVERIGNRIKMRSSLRLVCWLNLKNINEASCDDDSGACGVSGTYVIDVIKSLPSKPFATADFISIALTNITQVERSVDIFSRYTYNEQATQYLMYPYDYFALDIDIDYTIPCIIAPVIWPEPEPVDSVTFDSMLITFDNENITWDAI